MTRDELRTFADKQVARAEEYADARKIAGIAKVNLDLILAASLPVIREKKPSVGMEMAYTMLMETNEAARSFYREWVENEAVYKGLERLLEACSSKLIMEQSLMKHIKEGEQWGH